MYSRTAQFGEEAIGEIGTASEDFHYMIFKILVFRLRYIGCHPLRTAKVEMGNKMKDALLHRSYFFNTCATSAAQRRSLYICSAS